MQEGKEAWRLQEWSACDARGGGAPCPSKTPNMAESSWPPMLSAVMCAANVQNSISIRQLRAWRRVLGVVNRWGRGQGVGDPTKPR